MFVASDSMLIGIPSITTLSVFVCLFVCLLSICYFSQTHEHIHFSLLAFVL